MARLLRASQPWNPRSSLTACRSPARPRRCASRRGPVRLSITDRCDLACSHCRPADDAPYLDAAERLPVAHWIDLVKSLRDAGIHRVRLTGGEPLSHPT